jgi:hypothetical protein
MRRSDGGLSLHPVMHLFTAEGSHSFRFGTGHQYRQKPDIANISAERKSERESDISVHQSLQAILAKRSVLSYGHHLDAPRRTLGRAVLNAISTSSQICPMPTSIHKFRDITRSPALVWTMMPLQLDRLTRSPLAGEKRVEPSLIIHRVPLLHVR